MEDCDERKLKRKLDEARKSKNVESAGKWCRKLAELYSNRGLYGEALQAFTELLDICEEKHDLLGVANSNRMIGEMYNMLGQYEDSLKYSNLYLEYARSVKDKVEQQRALATIGRLYLCWASDQPKNTPSFQNCVKQCQKTFIKSLYICENELGNTASKEKSEMKARLFYNLGLVAELQEDYNLAQSYLSKAILICKTEALTEDLCKALNSQGTIHLKQEDHAASLNSYDQALEVANRTGSAEGKVVTLLLKADAYFQMSNYVGAKNVLKQAYKMKSPNNIDNATVESQLKLAVKLCMLEEKLSNIPEEALSMRRDAYEELGDVCCAVKNYKHGILFYSKMLECAEKAGDCGKQLLPCYESLSQTLQDDKQYNLALLYHQKELELYDGDSEGSCKTYLSMAQVLTLKGAPYTEVCDTYYKAKQLAEDSKIPQLQVNVLEGMIELFTNVDKPGLKKEVEKELADIKNIHCIDSDSESEASSQALANDINLDDVLSNSEHEVEEFDRPRVRNPRTTLKVKRNEKGETQLHVAVIKGDLKRVERLIAQGHPVKEQDLMGWSPLHEASNHGHDEIVRVLLDAGADINDPGGRGCKGVTPLHDAASCGHFQVIEILLQRGASPAVLTSNGETPLMCLKDWRKRVDLDENEEVIFDKVSQLLKTGLDRKTVRRSPCRDDTPLLLEDHSQKARQRNRFPSTGSLRRHVDVEETRWHETSPNKNETTEVHATSTRPTREEKTAQEEYKSAIEAVRKRNKSRFSTAVLEKNDSALVNEGDVTDEWLEDDLGIFERAQKKRKTIPQLMEHTSIRKKRAVEEDGGPEIRPAEDDSGQEEIDDAQVLEDKAEEEKIDEYMIEEGNIESREKKPGKKHKRQLTLLKSGFQKTRPADSEVVELMVEDDERENVTSPSRPPAHPHPPAQTILKLRIKIKDETFLIPVSNSEKQNIGWLAEEAARRYHILQGSRPVILLRTRDGATLSETDPVSVIVGEELEAVVLEWKSSTLTDRYVDAFDCEVTGADASCRQVPDEHIMGELEMCRATNCLNLQYLSLTPAELNPVFLALKHHTSLKSVNLAGNILGDEGFVELIKCLEKCQLQEMNVSCNDISSRGVDTFCSSANRPAPHSLSALRLLDLSFNPLGFGSINELNKLPQLLSNLSVLKLDQCQ